MIYTSDLADAIVAFLAALDLGEGVTIARTRLLETALESMTGTRIAVIPYGTTRNQEAEGVHRVAPDVRIVVQAKLPGEAGSSDGADANAAAKLSEDLARLLVGRDVLGFQCQSAKLAPSYDPDKLQELAVFDATIFTQWSGYEDGPDA